MNNLATNRYITSTSTNMLGKDIMAARRLIAIRFLRKESSIVATTHNIRLDGGYQLRQSQIANPSTTTHQHSIIRSFSSSQNNAKLVSKKKKVDNSKKSPHSKLLRVCSERNSNAHFAAIEGTSLSFGYHI